MEFRSDYESERMEDSLTPVKHKIIQNMQDEGSFPPLDQEQEEEELSPVVFRDSGGFLYEKNIDNAEEKKSISGVDNDDFEQLQQRSERRSDCMMMDMDVLLSNQNQVDIAEPALLGNIDSVVHGDEDGGGAAPSLFDLFPPPSSAIEPSIREKPRDSSFFVDDVAVDMLEEESLVPIPPASSAKIITVAFNQNASCAAISTTIGYAIYQCNPFKRCYDSKVHIPRRVEMLYTTSLIALIGSGEQPSFPPRCVKLLNTASGKPLCSLNFMETVLSIRIGYERLVAVTERKITIFDMKDMRKLHSIETCANPNGVIAVCSSQSKFLIAFPASASKGDLFLYDALNLHVLSIISAHDGPIRLMSFNKDGTRLATTSEKGTIVRVFSVPQGEKLFTFRRGIKQAEILSLSFNEDSSLLAAASDSNTIHVFQLTESAVASKKREMKLQSHFSSYLPSMFQNVMEPLPDIAKIRIRDDSGSIFSAFNSDGLLQVLSMKGYLYQYEFDKKSESFSLISENCLIDLPCEALGADILMYRENNAAHSEPVDPKEDSG